MNIEIENRRSIEKRAQTPFPPNAALISICDFDEEFARLKNKPAYLLQLKFDDVGADIFEDVLGRKPTKTEAVAIAQKYHMITSKQARQIADFYFNIKDEASLLICQCEHGESRSTAVAAAIAEFENKSGIKYFIDERYYPQKLIFRRIYKALTESE